ncbi:hypothetical protein CTEN210_02949 [Chaetoceros tenuissimus]|uniref:Uncharacterized protein n=1 Tax=Chaetoceros tenuissimus TaxID=426638 RepID=A0AAD3H130_9STRA|nr:hypothetical protein CTEN210_02949 [Chaetoceros tenuissimus]
MSSLAQQILELKSQLQCIQEYKEQWNDDECLQGIKMIILNFKEELREVFEKSYNHISRKFDKSRKSAQRLSEIRQWYLDFDDYNSHELTIETLLETQTQLESILGLAIRLEYNDKECMARKIIGIVQDTKRKLVKVIGESLHRLGHKLNCSINTVERMINMFPLALFESNNWGLLPIEASSVDCESVKYVPVLAKVGRRHNVGGEGKRGGLLVRVKYGQEEDDGYNEVNLLHFLSFHTECYSDDETKHEMDIEFMNALKALKKEGLLVKEDILDQDLLYLSAWKESKARFKFFLHWFPDAINKYVCSVGISPFMHSCLVHKRSMISIKAILETTFEYYPDQAGFLFQKDYKGQTAFEKGLEIYGEECMLNAIHDIISPNMDFPILHHAVVAAPKFTSIFANWFPWAYHVRDYNGRSLIQVILTAGGKCVNENSIICASMNDEQILEKDPVTTLYPFATIASGKDGDLQKSFYLLRRQPGVVNGMIPTKRRNEKSRNKKRKRLAKEDRVGYKNIT